MCYKAIHDWRRPWNLGGESYLLENKLPGLSLPLSGSVCHSGTPCPLWEEVIRNQGPGGGLLIAPGMPFLRLSENSQERNRHR